MTRHFPTHSDFSWMEITANWRSTCSQVTAYQIYMSCLTFGLPVAGVADVDAEIAWEKSRSSHVGSISRWSECIMRYGDWEIHITVPRQWHRAAGRKSHLFCSHFSRRHVSCVFFIKNNRIETVESLQRRIRLEEDCWAHLGTWNKRKSAFYTGRRRL